MIVESGVRPYAYSGPVPFRITEPEVGFSGILMEDAQFVVLAERRRYNDPGSLSLKYINPFVAPEIYEPRASGLNLADTGGLLFIDYIIDLREDLDALLGKVSTDTNYSKNEVLKDWLIKNCGSPSGFFGKFSREVPPSIGDILDASQLYYLGGSGVMLDLDFCEVMYQPYARMAGGSLTKEARVAGSGVFQLVNEDPITFVQTKPLWPAFQKTDGSLVSLSTTDEAVTRIFEDLPDGTNYDSVGSGKVRVDGDVLSEDTTYNLRASGEHGSSAFTFAASGIRPIVDVNYDDTRVYVTPTQQSSGIYQFGVENKLSDVRFAGVASGEISFWPPPGQFGGLAYEVFDDSFWFCRGSSPSLLWPSGLTLLGRYTGNPVWLRHADIEDGSDHDDLGTFQRTFNFSHGIGLARVSNDRVFRLRPNVNRTSNFPRSGSIHFMEYTDRLEFTADRSADQSIPTALPFTFEADDFYYGNSKFYFINNGGGSSNDEVFEVDPSTYIIDTYYVFSNPALGAGGLEKMEFLNGEHWLFQSTVNTSTVNVLPGTNYMRRMEFVAPGVFNDTIVPRETKIINTETIPGLSGIVGSNFIIEDISRNTETNEIWAMISFTIAEANTDYKSNVYLLKISENTTSWDVQEAIYAGINIPNDFGDRNDLLYMPVD